MEEWRRQCSLRLKQRSFLEHLCLSDRREESQQQRLGPSASPQEDDNSNLRTKKPVVTGFFLFFLNKLQLLSNTQLTAGGTLEEINHRLCRAEQTIVFQFAL